MRERMESIRQLGDGHWTAWWYGGLLGSKSAPSERLVSVNFRRIVGDQPEGPTVTKFIGITQIGQVPLGSIWHQGSRDRDLELLNRTFDVDFTDQTYQVVSLSDRVDKEVFALLVKTWPPLLANKPLGRAVEPEEVIKTELVPAKFERSYLIKLAGAGGSQLLLPCLEIFSRLYGRSAEVKRAIVGYPWDDSEHGAKRYLYARLEEPRTDNAWKVRLQRKSVNGDVVFLAHAEYDPFTVSAVKSIHAQIVTQEKRDEGSSKGSLCFPVIKPWFEGPATLKVAGIPLSENLFLGLRILGASDPDGVLIERDRVDRDKVATQQTDGFQDRFRPEAARRIRRLIKPPIVDLTVDEEPDQGSGIVEVRSDPFEVVGPRRLVVDLPPRVFQRIDRAVNVPGDGNETRFAGGTEGGTGKGVGYAHIQAPDAAESMGVQLGMWKALIDLKALYGDRVESVDWYTFNEGFSSNGSPKQIYFKPYWDAKDRLENGDSPRVINWIYIDREKKRVRGLVVMRIAIDSETIYMVEQSRRRDETDLGAADKEEKFSGLVFKLDLDDDLDFTLHKIMAALQENLGVMKHVLDHCPSEAHTYKHTSSKNEDQYSNTVKNALRKFQIRI